MTPSGAIWTPMGVFWDGSMGVPSPSTKVTPKCVDDIFSASLMLATDSIKMRNRLPPLDDHAALVSVVAARPGSGYADGATTSAASSSARIYAGGDDG